MTPVPLHPDQVRYITTRRPDIAAADAERALVRAQWLAWQYVTMLPAGADHEEMFVEAAFRVLKATDAYDPARGASFATFACWRVRTWLVVRVTQAYRWGSQRQYRRPRTLSLGAALDVPGAANVEAEVVSRMWVAETLQQAKADQRAVAELRFFEDLSYPEIAARLGINAVTARMRVRAMARMLAG